MATPGPQSSTCPGLSSSALETPFSLRGPSWICCRTESWCGAGLLSRPWSDARSPPGCCCGSCCWNTATRDRFPPTRRRAASPLRESMAGSPRGPEALLHSAAMFTSVRCRSGQSKALPVTDDVPASPRGLRRAQVLRRECRAAARDDWFGCGPIVPQCASRVGSICQGTLR